MSLFSNPSLQRDSGEGDFLYWQEICCGIIPYRVVCGLYHRARLDAFDGGWDVLDDGGDGDDDIFLQLVYWHCGFGFGLVKL